MYKALLFDLDGLLIDSEIISWKIINDMLEKYSKTGSLLTLEEYSRDFSGKTAEGNLSRLISKYDLQVSIPEGLEQEAILEKKYSKYGVDLKPGAIELLLWAREHGYKLALASSSLQERAKDILSPYGLWDIFDARILKEDLSKSKPDPEVFLKAASALNINPAGCLVLEDSENGIRAARAAGMDVVCVPDLNPPAKDYAVLCKWILPSLYDVMEHLKKDSDRDA